MIVRTGGQLARIQRYLISQGIEVRVPVAEKAVRDEAAVRPLLDAFAVVLDPDLLTPELAVSLLTSRIGGAGSLDLRRLRQALRREELRAGGGRSSDALLVEALVDPLSDSGLALAGLGWEAGAAKRLAAMLRAGREAAEQPGASAETVLWALWSTSGWSKKWAEAALSGGSTGLRADRDLDAIMALFQTAERYVDQLPGSTPEQFLDYLTSSELPMDTLAARAQQRDAVELLTPASAAGREWPVVIVAGIQEGVWPNLRLRGELLGSGDLVAAVEFPDTDYRSSRSPQTLMQATRYDELRSFSTALSRARDVLVCTAVSSEDEQPSQFLDLVDPLPDGVAVRPRTEVLRPLTLRSLVAELRAHAQQAEIASARTPGKPRSTWAGCSGTRSRCPARIRVSGGACCRSPAPDRCCRPTLPFRSRPRRSTP